MDTTVYDPIIIKALPKIAVIFNGRTPRLIGTLTVAPSATTVKNVVSLMLITQGLSAENISLCETPAGKLFVLAHG